MPIERIMLRQHPKSALILSTAKDPCILSSPLPFRSCLTTRLSRLMRHGNDPDRLYRPCSHIRRRHGVYVSLHHASSPQGAVSVPQRPPSGQQGRRHSSRNAGERTQPQDRKVLAPSLATAILSNKR